MTGQNLYFICEEIKVAKFLSTQSFDSKIAVTSYHSGCINDAQSINKQVGIDQIGGAESKKNPQMIDCELPVSKVKCSG